MANPLKLLKLKPQGFQFIQELDIDASPEKVWKALANVGQWFRFGNGDEPMMKLELSLGGRLYADLPNGEQFLMGNVTHIERNKLLRMKGGINHLPVTNVLIWELQPRRDGRSTLLRFAQRTFGFMTPDLKKNHQQGWAKFLPQLKALAEQSGGDHRMAKKSSQRQVHA